LRVASRWLAALLCLWVLYANVSPDFTPVRSELTSARGFARGVLNLVVLPDGQAFGHMPVWSFVICGALLVVVFGGLIKPALASGLTGSSRRDGVSRLLRPVPAALASLLLLAVALSPSVTPYRVILAPRTFALCVVLLCASRAAGVMPSLRRGWMPLASGALGAAFFTSMLIQTVTIYGGNYSGFIHLSRDVASEAPFLDERPDLARSLIVYDAGYDGQFIYLMAFDPFLQRFKDRPQEYRAFIDNPPYRYGRIGFSLLTKVASGGRAERFPAAMMWLIVAAHFGLAAMLGFLASRHGMSPLAALWYLAIPAFTSSLMSALPEALAAAGIVAGFLCWKARRPVVAAIAFGGALLVRETGIVLIVALVLLAIRQETERKRAALMFALALLPVSAWRLFVASRLFGDFGWAAVVPNPGDFGTPFAGLVQLWQAGITRMQPAPEIAGAMVFPIVLTAALLLAAALLYIRAGPIEIAAIVYAGIAVSLNYGKIWSHLPSGERGTFELFLCLLFLMFESHERPAWTGWALKGFFVVLLAYTFLLAPDASTSRAALLLIR